MCPTVFEAYTHSKSSSIPEPDIMLPMQPRKLISAWNPPRRSIIERSSLSGGSLSTISCAFHHKGWSNVIIGVVCCLLHCASTNLSVEYIQLMFVGSMSIIGKNVTEDFPGWLPLLIVCINPDQFGLGDRIGQTKLQRKSNFQVLLTLERHGSFS